MAPPTFTLASRIELANCLSMPQIHFVVYLTSGHETSQVVRWTSEVTIDSAQMVHNERESGRPSLTFSSEANTAALKREDIQNLLFTSKLASNSAYDAARRSVEQSANTCSLGYIGLFLLHSPYGGKHAKLKSCRAVEDAIDDGEIRVGGVKHLIASKPRIIPAVNQIEVHLFNIRTDITTLCQEHGIVVKTYAPLIRALGMKNATIISLSKKYHCTPGQLLVRRSLQNGNIPLPKSVKKERIVENGNGVGFEIAEANMKTMDGWIGRVSDWDPTDCP
ncbi:alcohol dehydrogenase [Lepidopterella palustris CBS 459.81]|uniref:Alcohol dehydrogenase n=1 Tax=Lepidopterella palustris CBS 459.81 TaxID=1314670 RepID=A0A8E2ECJ2_9PEZI|nr:alcohol dehydrogenase [Lepidopterella palustris CBS 459.81]